MGWIGWQDWFCSEFAEVPQYRSFEEAREFIQSLNLSKSTWSAYCNGRYRDIGIKPNDIPSSPDLVYAEHGWAGWSDWLYGFNQKYQDFDKAREYVHSLQLKTHKEWEKYIQGDMPLKGSVPDELPKDPYKAYHNFGWDSYEDWIGPSYEGPPKTFLPFKKARELVHNQKLNNYEEWKNYCQSSKRPNNLI